MFILLLIIKILLYLLLLLAGLILLLLLVPFNYRGRVQSADGFRAQVTLGWAWKLLGINAELEGENVDITFRILDKRVYKLKGKEGAGEEEKEAEEQAEKKEKAKKKRKGPTLRELTDKVFLNEILEYFKRVLGALKPKYLHLYGTYGFDDPSLTGIVCGVAAVIKGIVPNARLHLNPDFTREVFDIDFRAEGSVMAGSLAYQTIRTVLKRPVRKILFKKKKS